MTSQVLVLINRATASDYTLLEPLTMTVGELLDVLKRLDPKKPVVIELHDGSLADINGAYLHEIESEARHDA